MKKMKLKNITLDDLAGMVATGFERVDEKFEEIENRINNRFQTMEERFKTLEDGQEQIILRLDNTAYRFEFVALEKRVSHLEKKAGVRSR
jgi:hypothetical protein